MPQNTSYNTTERLIRQAYANCGLIGQGNSPNSEQLADGLNRLNDLIGLWQTQGLKLWTDTDQSITLVAGTGTYTMGTGGNITTRPLKITQAYFLDSNSLRRPLNQLSRQEYTLLSNPTQQGAINSFYFDPQQTLAQISFWLVPDTEAATGTAHVIMRRPITYVSGMSDLINFPQEWYMALSWGLSDELATGQPMSVQQRCMARAESFRRALEDWDVEEASTSFSPDTERMQGGSGFT